MLLTWRLQWWFRRIKGCTVNDVFSNRSVISDVFEDYDGWAVWSHVMLVFFSRFWKKSPSASSCFGESHNSVLLRSSRNNVVWPPKSPPVGMRRERLNFCLFALTFPLVFTVTDASFASLLINLYFMQEIKDSDDCLGQQGKKKTRQDLRVYSLQKMFQTTCISGAKTC